MFLRVHHFQTSSISTSRVWNPFHFELLAIVVIVWICYMFLFVGRLFFHLLVVRTTIQFDWSSKCLCNNPLYFVHFSPSVCKGETLFSSVSQINLFRTFLFWFVCSTCCRAHSTTVLFWDTFLESFALRLISIPRVKNNLVVSSIHFLFQCLSDGSHHTCVSRTTSTCKHSFWTVIALLVTLCFLMFPKHYFAFKVSIIFLDVIVHTPKELFRLHNTLLGNLRLSSTFTNSGYSNILLNPFPC